MAAVARINLLLLVAVAFQASLAAACVANEPRLPVQRDSNASVEEAPVGEAPTCVKDDAFRRRLAEISAAIGCDGHFAAGCSFTTIVDNALHRASRCGAAETPTISLQSERIRLQI